MPYKTEKTFELDATVHMKGTKVHETTKKTYQEHFLDIVVKITSEDGVHIEYQSDSIHKNLLFSKLNYISHPEIQQFIDNNVEYKCRSQLL